MLNRVEVESKMMKSAGYWYRTMEIEFQGGAVYRYRKVPRALFDAMMKASSKGAFFAQNIRHNKAIPFEKL